MERATFWSIIERARAAGAGASAEHVAEELIAQLARLPAGEIESFQGWLDAYRYAANRKELWAVAFYIGGGCSDDGFDYFRGWLIAQGEAVFLAAMHDPSSLVEHRWPGDDEKWPDMRCEDMLSVGRAAYETVTGNEMSWDLELPTIEERTRWPADRIENYEWTDADVSKLFPRLQSRWKAPR